MQSIDFLSKIDNSNIGKELEKAFIEKFSESKNKIHVIASPARVNLIGEHIDYNGGLVFPTAISIYMYVLIRLRDDNNIIYDDLRFNERFEFSTFTNFTYKQKYSYANYLNGTLKFFIEQGLKLNTGFEVLIFSNIPQASSISSSAALEIGFGKAVTTAYDFNIDNKTLALTGKKVENEYLGLQSGIMDQFIIANAKANTAMLLNTATLEHEYIPFHISPYKLIVMNSCKSRKLVESKYNERKTECDIGLKTLQKKININNLCELNLEEYKKHQTYIIETAGNTIHKRVKHCITENQRVTDSVFALKHRDFRTFGKLMVESHISLHNDYEVTGFELNSLFSAAMKQEGCIGARMTGAGFSGCAIALIHQDHIQNVCQHVSTIYKKETGLTAEFYDCNSVDGTHIIN